MSSGGIKARPVGRILRLLVGVALVVEGGRHLIGRPELAMMAGGVIVGEFLFYAVLHVVIDRFAGSINAWLGAILAVMPVLLVYVLSPAPGKLGTLLFVGISLVFTALRNDAGCEVMTLPGIVLGKRTHLVCVAFSPIDWLEERRWQGQGNNP